MKQITSENVVFVYLCICVCDAHMQGMAVFFVRPISNFHGCHFLNSLYCLSQLDVVCSTDDTDDEVFDII